jgi:hypothetical protein
MSSTTAGGGVSPGNCAETGGRTGGGGDGTGAGVGVGVGAGVGVGVGPGDGVGVDAGGVGSLVLACSLPPQAINALAANRAASVETGRGVLLDFILNLDGTKTGRWVASTALGLTIY